MSSDLSYQEDLAWVHHQAFGEYPERAARGIVALLQDGGLHPGACVLDVGCGSGHLAAVLLSAGFRVLGVDASPEMVALARRHAPGARFEVVRLPTGLAPGAAGGLPLADAVVSTGHVLNYLPSPPELERGMAELAGAVRPGGLLALDLMTERFARSRLTSPPVARVEEDWAIVVRSSRPAARRLDRQITLFRREGDRWRRTDELHRHLTCEASEAITLLRAQGIEAEERASFGDEPTLEGVTVVVGRRR